MKNWTPLSDVSEEAFKTWQAQIIAFIAGDKDLHPLIVSESGKLDRLIRHTTDTSRNRALYNRLAPCILAATAAPYIKRNGIAGQGIQLFYLLDSVFIDRSPAAKQSRITTFLTSIQRSPTEPIDAYYNRYSTLLADIDDDTGFHISSDQVRERFLRTLGGQYDYITRALDRKTIDPYLLDCSDDHLLTHLRNIRDTTPKIELVKLPISNNQLDAGKKVLIDK